MNFTAPSLDGRHASVRLDDPQDGWTVEPKPFVLRPKVLYHAYGYRGQGHARVNTMDVGFSAESIAGLKPGSVLIQRYEEKASPHWVDTTITQEEFDRQAQSPTICQ
ncbi:hypothetical protein DP939_03700 [Spongiactinospora rosea]|uniref:Uncharacterized protein n=1 Tax=Spongiactinospora rosea TaxID=2248750 RepID=A0A366M7U5_9ACTN|nr:hypothetical protein DP939_03700 [Spongiactinospora rosea]